jgi:hypothetical protein
MLDAKLIFCEDQVMPNAGSILATDWIDLGDYETNLGEEEHLRVRVEIAKDATVGTSIKVDAVHDTVAPIDGSSIVYATSGVVLLADAVKGKILIDAGLPIEHGKLLGLYFTADGDMSVGTINGYVYAR